MILAQVAPVSSGVVGGILDTADRVGTMSAAGIGALIVIVALVFAYWQMNERAKAEKRTGELLEARAMKSEGDLVQRLAEQKADSAANKAEVVALARESDETLAMMKVSLDAVKLELELSRAQRAQLVHLIERLMKGPG